MNEKIPLSEKLIYGAADLFGGGHNTILSVILLYFFTNAIGLKAALAGTVVLLSKLWDAVIDPFLGAVSDNTRSKFGRRKPYILAGAILIIPAYALLFAPVQALSPDSLKTAYAIFAYLFYCTVASLSQVPFMSMSSDISPDFDQRNSANLIKLIFDMASAGVCYLVPTMLIDALADGKISFNVFYLSIVFGFGTVFSIPLIAAAFKLKERVALPAERSKFNIKEWLSAFKIKSYRYHIFMYITAFLCVDIVSALALYYVNDVLRGVTVFGRPIGSVFVIAPMMVSAALVVPVCYKLMRKRSKQFAYRVGLPLYALGIVLLAGFKTSWSGALVPLFACLAGLGLGGAQMMPWLIFPDTVDIAELKLGYRPTGAFSGAMTFARTLSTAAAIQIVGFVLELSHYQESTGLSSVSQPPEALAAIRVMLGASAVVLLSLAFVSSVKYKVTDKKLLRVGYFSEIRRKGLEQTLTAAEKKEMQALLEELA
ncbi:MAG: MFS transporter [Clostridiales bacterium]|jgi:Na+/melibiose symporter-like transporter|nr:MFS transporter [Clostridiales bacterium]